MTRSALSAYAQCRSHLRDRNKARYRQVPPASDHDSTTQSANPSSCLREEYSACSRSSTRTDTNPHADKSPATPHRAPARDKQRIDDEDLHDLEFAATCSARDGTPGLPGRARRERRGGGQSRARTGAAERDVEVRLRSEQRRPHADADARRVRI